MKSLHAIVLVGLYYLVAVYFGLDITKYIQSITLYFCVLNTLELT
jgi:hypothetical protein